MKNVWPVGLLVFFSLFLLGMGTVESPLSVDVPEPGRNFSATVTDQSDVSTRLNKFSLGGQTFISGKLGDADISITFDKIERIDFLLRDDTLTAEVHLKDGKVIAVVVDKETACHGEFTYGGFRIALEDVRSITIHGEVSP
jgi:hypothetical protein